MNFPIATYRIQFYKDFGFDSGAAQLSYLKTLGISHLYSSPCLKAVRGSMHGYDVADFTKINPEPGGDSGHDRLCRALQKIGMGYILDIVPNHMAAHGKQNPLWRDVLAFGLSSPYADFFDIDWQTRDMKIRNKVLLPLLGDHYDICLENKQLQFRRLGSEIVLTYFDHELPVSTQTINEILDLDTAHTPWPKEWKRDSAGGYQGDGIDALLEDINNDPDRIHALLELQHYCLAYWRTAASDINYRRFFDISDLVGIRSEKEAVFQHSHQLIFKWINQGKIDGLRIDHPDGLSDPEEYLENLTRHAPCAWIVVEKILSDNERLPESWPVGGTTGYDFLNRLNGLFVDPSGEDPMTRLYTELTGQPGDYAEIVRRKKHQILEKSFFGEIESLARLLFDIRLKHRPYRDVIYPHLFKAIREIIACFPVYRSYVRPNLLKISPADMQWIQKALALARIHQDDIDEKVWELIESLLHLKLRGPCEKDFILRFQQLTSTAMAKGAEDTAFYCFNRLVSLNEVGGNPGRFGTSMKEFHEYCRFLQTRYPRSLTATTTHDAKRGEDTRLRINLLSEIPERWSEAVRNWFDMTAKYRTGSLPDPNTLYLLFQTLVGTWPINEERLTGYMEKAVREAKVHTSWKEQDENYESILLNFINKTLSDTNFIHDLEAFLSELIWPARISSLSQTLIKCTAPGIPDFYQGTELWDLNLVDPDNRRPVDYEHRRRMISQINGKTGPDCLSEIDSGLPKLFIIQSALSVRRGLPDLFGHKSTYRPLYAEGSASEHVLAFVRGENVITVAPRLVLKLNGNWEDTVIILPPGTWENVFSGEQWPGGRIGLFELLAGFPVALLIRS